jgi:hypothetical protein
MNRIATSTTRKATAAVAGAVLAGLAFGAITAAPASAAVAEAVTTTAVDPNDALLRAAQMPVVNEVQAWQRVATRTGRISRFQPAPFAALDPSGKARRDFVLPGAQATNVVLTFDDTAEAAQAYAAVRAWRQHTARKIPDGGRLLYTGRTKSVAVRSGAASYFDVAYKVDDSALEGTFEWVGVTQRGARVSIVVWRVGGQDATYDVDPTVAALKAANAKLARLG